MHYATNCAPAQGAAKFAVPFRGAVWYTGMKGRWGNDERNPSGAASLGGRLRVLVDKAVGGGIACFRLGVDLPLDGLAVGLRIDVRLFEKAKRYTLGVQVFV